MEAKRTTLNEHFGIDDTVQVGVGDFVRIHPDGESFWVEVVDQSAAGEIVGRVDNYLACTDRHGLEFGDLVAFGREHVMVHMTPTELREWGEERKTHEARGDDQFCTLPREVNEWVRQHRARLAGSVGRVM